MRRGISELLTRIFLPVLSVGLVCAVFEVGLRLTDHKAIYEIYSKPSLFWQHDELLGWSHTPNVQGEYVGPRPWPIEFRGNISINSLGLRGPEVPPRRPGEPRVLFLGDSMVASFEVDYDVSFVALLETLLSERTGQHVRAINAGVRGYGTDQSYLYFRERGWKLEPDLVVFYHSGNDPSDNTTLHEMRRPFGKAAFSLTPAGSLELVGVPVPRFPMCSEYLLSADYRIERVDSVVGRALCRAQMALFDHSALFSFVTLAVPWDSMFLQRLYYLGNPHADQLIRGATVDSDEDPESRLCTALVIALAHEVERRGADFIVIGNQEQLGQLELAELEAQHIPVVGLALSEEESLRLRWQHDAHLNAIGHRWLADRIVNDLERELRARPAESSHADRG